MDLKFVGRGLILALPVAVFAAVAWLLLQTPLGKPLDPTPPSPTILALRGRLPAGPSGLQEWAQYRGADYQLVGCGFLLSLPDGQVVGVTTAHSVGIGDADRCLERIALGVSGHGDFLGAFDTLWGLPGQPLDPEDMTVDYVLLEVDIPIEPDLVVSPDPRGAPQPGERVTLFSGLGDDLGYPRMLEGTVQSVSNTVVWVTMDHWFDPGMMSGSPFVSQHTGQVVGMAVAASPRRNGLLLGMHPIGSLMQLAKEATEFPKIRDMCASDAH
jgi:hypothetical protein